MKIVWGRSIGWNLDNNIIKGKGGRYYLRWGDKRKKLDYTILTEGAGCYPWCKTFIWWPWTTTITGQRIFWKTIYKRRVWVVWGNGFHMEPETQYATLFEILADETSVNET
jgi:hypothetical protein